MEAERVLKPGGTFLATTNSQHGMPALGTLHRQTMQHIGIAYHAEVNEPFSLENGEEQLQRMFPHVELLIYEAGFRVSDPGPVLQYYMATQLYQRPSKAPSIPQTIRPRDRCMTYPPRQRGGFLTSCEEGTQSERPFHLPIASKRCCVEASRCMSSRYS